MLTVYLKALVRGQGWEMEEAEDCGLAFSPGAGLRSSPGESHCVKCSAGSF